MSSDLTVLEMADVQRAWNEGGGRPGMSGLGATWYQWPGDILTLGRTKYIREWIYGPDDPTAQYKEDEAKAAAVRAKQITAPVPAPMPAPEPIKKEEAVVTDKQTDWREHVLGPGGPSEEADACQAKGWKWTPWQTCEKPSFYETDEFKSMVPWFVAGVLGLGVVALLVRRK